MDIDPAQIPIADRYKLMIGAIVPRPIAWVSTLSRDGRPNLAPFSFFAGVGSNPMTLLFCPANKPDGTEKDSLRNAAPIDQGGTGEFVVNIVPSALVRSMAACAEPLEFGESEWALAGLESRPSKVVKPGRVHGVPLALECRTLSITRTNPGQPAGGNIVLGQVVHIWAAEGAIDPARLHISPEALDAVGRMGGITYCRTRERFDLASGRAALA